MLTEAPGTVDPKQLRELNIRLRVKEEAGKPAADANTGN